MMESDAELNGGDVGPAHLTDNSLLLVRGAAADTLTTLVYHLLVSPL
jgi:hypothetical protein